VSVCMQHPGHESDVVVTTPTPELAMVFNGVESWHRAVAAGTIAVAGLPRLVRALPTWFAWSPFADATRERLAMG
jgi:hypothetical protein